MTVAELKQTLHDFAEERAPLGTVGHPALAPDLAELLLFVVQLADRRGVDLLAAASERLGTAGKPHPPAQ